MNDVTFTPERSDAMRHAIVDHVDEASSPANRRAHRLLAAVLTAGAGIILVGGGLTAASAAGLIDWPFANQSPLPGGDTAVVVSPSGEAAGDGPSEPVVLDQVGRGSAEMPLPGAPADATHLSVQFTCLTPDEFYWGVDPVNNPGMSCGPADIGARSDTAWYDFPLDGGSTTFYIRAEPEAAWRLSAVFLSKETTEWAVNENGQTYGIANENGTPDLVAVVTEDGVEGYAYAEELAEADGSAAAKTFDSPDDALRWQEAREGKRISVPVYTSDGKTVLGEFVIQNW